MFSPMPHAPPAVDPTTPAAVMPSGEQFDRTCAAIRCVAAAEIYKLTGRVPDWAQAAGAPGRN